MWYKLFYKIGSKLRNPSLSGWYNFLKQSEKWDVNQLEAYQLKKLKELVVYATSNAPFYKNFYSENNVTIENIQCLKTLKELPILTKENVLNNSAQIQIKLTDTKLFHATTSGSTGESLTFKRDESADSFNRAAQLRGYSWYRINPWDNNGYLWGYNFSKVATYKTKLLDFFQNRFRLFSYREKELNSFLKKLQNAKYLEGYSSMIYQLAKMVNKNPNQYNFNLKLVKGTSEKIYASYKAAIKKAFKVNFTSEYGAAESGIIAFECKAGNMHINMEGVIVEEVDSELVVTNLQMKSFPIIRYKLGDYIKLAPKAVKCKCGIAHQIIEEVSGRVGENVYGKQQAYPSLYFYYIFKNLGKKHHLDLTYQVVQQQKGHLFFYIENDLNVTEKENLRNEIEKHFKNDITYTIVENATLKRSGGKLKSFISKLQN